jgi:hypothetical protein
MSANRRRILDAMRSGEWLRTQWIARVAFGVGSAPWSEVTHLLIPTVRVLRALEHEGIVRRRDALETRRGDIGGVPVAFDLPRREWQLVGRAD